MVVKEPLWIYIDALLDDFPDEYREGIVDDAAQYLCRRIEGLELKRYSFGVKMSFKYPAKTRWWIPNRYRTGDLYDFCAIASEDNPDDREAWKFLLSRFVASLIAPKMNEYGFEFNDIVKRVKGKIL